jgi:hypothetical protein
MATAKDFRRIALSLEGTTEAPAFRSHGVQGNAYLRDTCRRRKTREPDVCYGRTGVQMRAGGGNFFRYSQRLGGARATTLELSKVSVAELRDTLTIAWKHAVLAKPSRSRKI